MISLFLLKCWIAVFIISSPLGNSSHTHIQWTLFGMIWFGSTIFCWSVCCSIITMRLIWHWKQVLIPIANGSEEMEIIILVDILRRAKINVVLASVEKSPTILGSQRMKIVADKSIMSASDSIYDLIIFPVSSLAVHLFTWMIINGDTHFNNRSAI